MTDLSLASQTMFAELLQRCLDAEFDELYNERGRFVRVRSPTRSRRIMTMWAWQAHRC